MPTKVSPSNCDCWYAKNNACDCEVCCVSSLEDEEGPFKRPPEEQ